MPPMPAFSARNAQKSANPTERQPQPLIDPVQFHHQAPRAKTAKRAPGMEGLAAALRLCEVRIWMHVGAAVLHTHATYRYLQDAS